MIIKTLCIFGTRPEALKMAPVIKQLNEHPLFSNKICTTGQHRELLTSVLHLFDITPHYNLHVMSNNQKLSQLTSKILLGLDNVLNEYTPDLVLVHGDTTTTLAATLSAYYHQIPVAHVEAGLRTGDLHSPWPEEGNRKVTGALATLHFAPTITARDNLLHEGIDPSRIFVTGNTIVDTLHEIQQTLKQDPSIHQTMHRHFPFLVKERKILLVTAHRRENFGQGFEQICKALITCARLFPDVDIVFPVHWNPNVQERVTLMLAGIKNIYLLNPINYLSFVYLMNSCYLILTDSGGIQEEAPSLGKPVLLMRNKTERLESMAQGLVTLVGTDVEKIVTHVARLIEDEDHYQARCMPRACYGDGEAAKRIVQILAELKEGILRGCASMDCITPSTKKKKASHAESVLS